MTQDKTNWVAKVQIEKTSFRDTPYRMPTSLVHLLALCGIAFRYSHMAIKQVKILPIADTCVVSQLGEQLWPQEYLMLLDNRHPNSIAYNMKKRKAKSCAGTISCRIPFIGFQSTSASFIGFLLMLGVVSLALPLFIFQSFLSCPITLLSLSW